MGERAHAGRESTPQMQTKVGFLHRQKCEYPLVPPEHASQKSNDPYKPDPDLDPSLQPAQTPSSTFLTHTHKHSGTHKCALADIHTLAHAVPHAYLPQW